MARACTLCKTISPRAKLETPGSGTTTFILCLFFLVPGIIYGVWRHASERRVCPSCGSTAIVPTDSPVGQQIAATQPEAVERATIDQEPSGSDMGFYVFIGVVLIGLYLMMK